MLKEKLKYLLEIIILVAFVLGYYYYTNPKVKEIKPVGNIEENLKIYFIDVGEADSTLIYNNGEYTLIDAGNNKDGKKLVNYFKELGVTKFKYVITTHVHEDHIGGMDNIIREFPIEHFLIPDTPVDNMTYTEVIKELNNRNITIETPNIDDIFNMEEVNFKVLSIGNDLENLNDTSIVLKANYKNTNYLFMADATKAVESTLLNKDILKYKNNSIKSCVFVVL